jgi:hypothetical protein
MIPAWLLSATSARAHELGLDADQRGAVYAAILRDWMRRTGRRRDRRQPPPGLCTLVPCACVRVDVLEVDGGERWRYQLRWAPGCG